MDITAEDFRRHFDLLSDEALLATNREELVELAQECYDEEVSKRGLNASPEQDAVPVEAVEEAGAEGDELMPVAVYGDSEEARLANETLGAAGIPARLVKDPEEPDAAHLQLMVAPSDFFKALDALGLQISEEELSAQAEAAGEGIEEG